MRNPTIRGKGAEIFFPKKTVEQYNKGVVEQKNSRTVESQPASARRQGWKSVDKTQISMWLSKDIVKKLKFKSIEENKKFSTVIEELLKKGL